MRLQQHTPLEKDLQIFQVANSMPCITPPSGSILCSGSSVTHPLSVLAVRSGVHWRRRSWVGGWGKKGPFTTQERLPPTRWPGSLCNQHKSIKYRTSWMCNSLSLSPCMVLETMWCQKLKDTLSSVETNAEEKSCWNLRLKRKEGTVFSSEMDHKTFFLLRSVTR